MAEGAISKLVSLVGTAVVLKCLYDLVTFLSLYLTSPGVQKFVYGRAPYALVTGATDGIGKATAKELYSRGFNLVLHGRNPEKLDRVREEIKQMGARDVRVWVEDASRAQIDFEKAVKQWDDIEITLVVHNVGGAPPRDPRIDGVAEESLLVDVRKNMLFPFLLSRAVLPKLRKASGPAKMVYIGSFSGETDIPRLTPYCATKAFVKRLSGCLGQDERTWSPTNVSTTYVIVGSVVSNTHKVEASLFSPSSESYARALVDKIGYEKGVLIPWFPHALQFQLVSLLPSSLLDKTLAQSMEKELELVKKL